eukprot:1158107-Pelagomonas_calceolata.AAC.2
MSTQKVPPGQPTPIHFPLLSRGNRKQGGILIQEALALDASTQCIHLCLCSCMHTCAGRSAQVCGASAAGAPLGGGAGRAGGGRRSAAGIVHDQPEAAAAGGRGAYGSEVSLVQTAMHNKVKKNQACVMRMRLIHREESPEWCAPSVHGSVSVRHGFLRCCSYSLPAE